MSKLNRPELRSKAKTALRRGMGRVEVLDRIAAKHSEQRLGTLRLMEFYERLRCRYAADAVPAVAADTESLPDEAEIAAVEAAIGDNPPAAEFLRVATEDADFDRGVVALVRDLLDNHEIRRARSIAQVLQHHPMLTPLGDICQAVVTGRDPMPATSWAMFTRNDPALAMRLAPAAYFRLGFAREPDTARAVLRRALDGELRVIAGPAGWLDIARVSFVAGAEDLAAGALDRAHSGLGALRNKRRARNLGQEIDWLRGWLGRAARAFDPVDVPAGELPFAVLDGHRPDQRGAPNSADSLQSAALLGQLARRRGLRFTGDPGLVGTAEVLRSRIAAGRVVDSGEATLRLVPVDRDASSYSAVPEGTWLIASGWFMHKLAGLRFELPLNPRLRPIFISLEINAGVLLQAGTVDYLRRYAPIGCRDWNTVHLLQAAGVPAFFSGWLTTTLDLVVPDVASGEAPASRPELFAALDEVAGYRSVPPVTDQLRTYLAARSVGAPAQFRANNPNDSALEALVGISDADVDAHRRGIEAKLGGVLAAIEAGLSEDEVYAQWRELCAPDVAAADARFVVDPIPPPSFDITTACAAVLAASVVTERSEPGPAGSEINLEFSLDGNFKHQLDVVLESIVARSSRPIRAFMLCRDHTAADHDRMAGLFPEVSFVWLPMDLVDYGPIAGMLRHITVATMDRLLLPDLLRDVDRILHHDLDALCRADLAELYDVEMGDRPIAARDQLHPNFGSGFVSMTRAAKRVSSPELSRELILRTHTRHRFDFKIFNAGIMVLNLDRMRRDDFCRQYLPWVERFGFNDQAVLNAYAGSDRVAVAAVWNAFPKFEVVDDAKILHWLGPMKPWDALFVDGRDLWREAEARFAARADARAAATRPA